MKISFHGADRGVTGSCHLVSCAGKQILIDCGLYQGGRELEEENREPFGFDPAQIDFVLLTHAHLDHCGRLPLLVKRGFCGEIITTTATRELARIVMVDAAHLQEEEARHRGHRSRHHGRHAHTLAPLYSILDAFATLDFFGRTIVYEQPVELAPGIRATFLDAGHILGSACIFWNWKKLVDNVAYYFPVILVTATVPCCAVLHPRLKRIMSSWKLPTVTACTNLSGHQ